ncbi:hypothetical protein DF216_01550 [Streptococcus oralis]|uniref:Uncharacterized protein n=1 Tax=Streptococcus oralis TaxID=1303 RepID=A0A4Q2FSF6_STROR|nr:hypothetical protein DF216_01550 [Streptococcus oralis]
MIYLVFRNENSYKIWYTNSSFQELISSACYRFTYKIWGIDTYLPREGPETKNNLVSKELFLISIDTYLPREGPETLTKSLVDSSDQCIAPYQPREGPETRTVPVLFWKKFQYRYLSTSQGAGNFLSLSPVDCMSTIV